jgi:hypothetical protein
MTSNPDYTIVYNKTEFNPLTPELNPSMQCCLMRLCAGDFAS